MTRPPGSRPDPRSRADGPAVTTQQLDLLATVSLAVCWGAVALACRHRVPQLVPGLHLISGHKVAR